MRTHFGLTDEMKVYRGTVQGDALSPLIFILYIEPLLRWLSVGDRGYKHATSSVTTHSSAFADDLAITCKTAENLAIQMQKVQLFSDRARLRINTSKSAITSIRSRTPARLQEAAYNHITYTHPEKGTSNFPYLHNTECYKYLGV